MRHTSGNILRERTLIHPGTRGWLFFSLLLFSVLILSCASSTEEPESTPDGSDRPPVELTAEVSRAEAGISDPIFFRVTLDAEPDISVSLPEVGSRIQGLRILDFGTEGPEMKEGRMWTLAWYKLQADLVGSYLLPSFQAHYTDEEGNEQTAETPQIFVEIKSTLNPEAGEQDIRDIKPLEKTQRELPVFWIIAAAGCLLLLGAVTILLLVRRRKKAREELRLPPEELARKELRDLESTGILDEQRYREYVFNLSMIFRRYLERRYGFPALEQTTEEILAKLRKGKILEEERKREVRSFLEDTDPIKYRGLEPQGEGTGELRAQLLSFLERDPVLTTEQAGPDRDTQPPVAPGTQTLEPNTERQG